MEGKEPCCLFVCPFVGKEWKKPPWGGKARLGSRPLGVFLEMWDTYPDRKMIILGPNYVSLTRVWSQASTAIRRPSGSIWGAKESTASQASETERQAGQPESAWRGWGGGVTQKQREIWGVMDVLISFIEVRVLGCVYICENHLYALFFLN